MARRSSRVGLTKFESADTERIWEQLKRIADALETMIVVMVQEDQQPAAATTCPHPEEERISFGVTRGQADWMCRSCGYRTVQPEV